MGLYNMLFGANPHAAVILATLKLTRDMVGRFRDCFVADGQIALYTRCGGNNRQCWHAEEPDWGEVGCQHHVIEVEADETEKVPFDDGLIGMQEVRKTGRRVMEKRYVCEQPASLACACYGCWVTYRIPQHPNFVRSVDDDFDNTYATVYFRFPEEYAAGLAAMDAGEPWDPDARWMAMLDALGAKT